jgi:hypothetical protein
MIPVLPAPKRQRIGHATSLAQKYGESTATVFIDTGKSGFTPQTPHTPSKPRSPRSLIAGHNIRYYQMNFFQGFTTAQLSMLGAIDGGQIVRPSDLQAIHPLYAREQWEVEVDSEMALYPLGNGREGYWAAADEEVWKLLRPCLALATMFITKVHCLPG